MCEMTQSFYSKAAVVFLVNLRFRRIVIPNVCITPKLAYLANYSTFFIAFSIELTRVSVVEGFSPVEE